MDQIINQFILFVFDHPEEDVLDLYNRFVRGLNETNRKQFITMFPLIIESAETAKHSSEAMKSAIKEDIRSSCCQKGDET